MVSNPVSENAIDAKSKSTEVHCNICRQPLSSPEFDLVARDGPFTNAKELQKRNFFRCGNCGFMQADLYDSERYHDYYGALNPLYHQQHDEDKLRYEIAFRKLGQSKITRILDWGCGSGAFLARLSSDVEKLGIEPSHYGANEARKRGITILSHAELHSKVLAGTFDAITLLDVIEHTWDLAELKETILHLLSPGGLLLIVTGDTGSDVATKLGPYWYYLHYSEHVSFFNESSIERWLAPDFANISLERMTHHSVSLRQRFHAFMRFMPVWVSSKLLPGNPLKRSAKLPASNDHMIVCARRRV